MPALLRRSGSRAAPIFLKIGAANAEAADSLSQSGRFPFAGVKRANYVGVLCRSRIASARFDIVTPSKASAAASGRKGI